jgi:pimeloyl-ACP methyl ester carboxylesterase
MQLSGKFFRWAGKPEAGTDSRFGPAPLPPMIQGRLVDEGCEPDIAFVVVHPSGDFLPHYLMSALPKRKAACLAVNTRYVGNDTYLMMEKCILDLGLGIRFLRESGYRRIVLVGNSGGASLSALYQAEAEHLTIATLPDGTPLPITAGELPPVDGLAMLAAHPGRAQVLTDWLDPSVMDEGDASSADSTLDMFNPKNGPPYSNEWILRYRAAQMARNEAITDRALATLAEMGAGQSRTADALQIVHRTGADPRFLDIAIDPDDRVVQKADAAKASNYATNNMARLSTLRSWLSQWSVRCTRANGPKCLARTTVPVAIMRYGADGIVFPSQIRMWTDAVGDRGTTSVVPGANHFLRNQPDLHDHVANGLIAWARDTVR